MNKLLNLLTPTASTNRQGYNITQMQEDTNDGRSKNYILMRTLRDVVMGIIYIAVALLFIFARKLGFSSPIFDPPFNYMFAGICIAYGSFRIYRGVKKNYFRS